MTRVAFVTTDPLGERMAGLGIRALELARAVAATGRHEVRLASTVSRQFPHRDVDVVAGDDTAALRALVGWSEVVVFQGVLLHLHPWIARSDRILVADSYAPFHLEQLHDPRADSWASATAVHIANRQLDRADLVLCASEKQRDLWLGQMAALGRVNPLTHAADPTLRNLVAVVPFGLPDDPPVATGPALRGVVPGIGRDDRVVVWGGGLYPWFDPQAVVRAVARVRDAVPEVRLILPGGAHPNATVDAGSGADDCRRLARELGLLDRHVHVLDRWIPYAERQNLLLEADVGISTHHDHLETAYSFRTRMLDYLWAGLPMVTTGGDAFAELIEQRGLGRTVPAGDVDAIAGVLVDLLTDDDARAGCRQRVQDVATRFRWSAVAAPLIAFLDDPRPAADRMARDGNAPALRRQARRLLPSYSARRWTARRHVSVLTETVRQRGVRTATRKLWTRTTAALTGRVD